MPNPNDLTQLEIAYLAGIIDGEGCIFIHRRRDRTSGFEPGLTITNTNPVLIDWLVSNLGGSVTIYKRDGLKDRYTWSMHGRKAVELASIVLPYLKIKSQQASILKSFWRIHESWGVTSGTHPFWGYGDQANALSEAISILNQGGKI